MRLQFELVSKLSKFHFIELNFTIKILSVRYSNLIIIELKKTISCRNE